MPQALALMGKKRRLSEIDCSWPGISQEIMSMLYSCSVDLVSQLQKTDTKDFHRQIQEIKFFAFFF